MSYPLKRKRVQYEQLFRKAPISEALPKHQPWDHVIPIEKEKSPPFGPLYPLSEKELKVLKEYIDDNLKTGHIRPSTSSAGSPVLFVPKKDSSLRLCVDYQPLNNITIKDRYAPLLLHEMNDRFQGAKIFTKLDLRGAYALVRIKAGEEWKTAFCTCYSLFEYQVMPFGLTNAPASFLGKSGKQHSAPAMAYSNTKSCHVFTVVYLDNILVYSKTEEEHVEHVKLVLAKLKARQLLLKLEKYDFHKQEVEFLGHLVGTKGVRMDPKKVSAVLDWPTPTTVKETPSRNQGKVEFLGHLVGTKGVRMDPKKVSAVLDWPTPTTVKEVQAFLGFANFYRRFIAGYSKVAQPLTELTKKDLAFN
ncbi:hypothetical protein V493_00557 [Pseudogymnoascus sp. VKM F-4281 (FW-2241)]|nr:hypothetical protein V493_00557 [Pseudogymnoascus sp. VKM F-4281 (FW-2241)]